MKITETKKKEIEMLPDIVWWKNRKFVPGSTRFDLFFSKYKASTFVWFFRIFFKIFEILKQKKDILKCKLKNVLCWEKKFTKTPSTMTPPFLIDLQMRIMWFHVGGLIYSRALLLLFIFNFKISRFEGKKIKSKPNIWCENSFRILFEYSRYILSLTLVWK